jgi:Rrf2 family transcriptional regulator, nitric oxide-sensitive transcriptional repressor
LPWSQTTEYALRAMVTLAARHDDSLTTSRIADVTGIPSTYLSKVMQTLGRADLVRAQRGLGGGFTLARTPEAITVLDVVNAVDPLRRIRECPLGVAGHGPHLCTLHQRMDDALATLEQVFAETRISDLLKEAGGAPLCHAGTRRMAVHPVQVRGAPKRAPVRGGRAKPPPRERRR